MGIKKIMETLTKLFGNAAKVKIIKQFLFNPNTPFGISDIADRTKESESKVRKEINLLAKMRLVKRKVFSKTIYNKKKSKITQKKVRVNGWLLNSNFEYLVPLQSFLINVNHLSPKDISRKLNRGGNLKLVITSGVFIQDPESRVDLLVVGDHLKKGVIDSTIKTIESEIGKDIRYAVFETPDFQYRLGLYDKLIRDILDSPHEKILNKLGV